MEVQNPESGLNHIAFLTIHDVTVNNIDALEKKANEAGDQFLKDNADRTPTILKEWYYVTAESFLPVFNIWHEANSKEEIVESVDSNHVELVGILVFYIG